MTVINSNLIPTAVLDPVHGAAITDQVQVNIQIITHIRTGNKMLNLHSNMRRIGRLICGDLGLILTQSISWVRVWFLQEKDHPNSRNMGSSICEQEHVCGYSKRGHIWSLNHIFSHISLYLVVDLFFNCDEESKYIPYFSYCLLVISQLQLLFILITRSPHGSDQACSSPSKISWGRRPPSPGVQAGIPLERSSKTVSEA